MTESFLPGLPQGAPPFDAAHALASGLVNALRLARAMAETGRPLDLSGLEEPVGLLCAKALDLPPEQGRALRPALLSLLAEAEALQGALARFAVPEALPPPDPG
ncbi:MAG: hypothetical protein JOZ58_11475 [Acetobacteraceae bacterium]|nr:hypothetical protein [Acetobacteraceae bacterium]MBV8575637.1 hypothetical protein [Acetobacteraceae bacterium]